MQEHDAMNKIFRIALLIFATTFGIGLYALIGAPVQRINYDAYASKLGAKIASVGEAALKTVPIPHFIPQKGPIDLELSSAPNDLPALRNIMSADDFGSSTTREIAFTKDKKALSGEALLAHFAGSKLSRDLGHLLTLQRYFIKRDDAYRGTLLISTSDDETAFAAMLRSEAQLSTAMMSLAHPAMSVSEIRMLTKIPFASRMINGVDARAITTSDDAPILIWGIHDGILIITGDRNDFSAALQK